MKRISCSVVTSLAMLSMIGCSAAAPGASAPPASAPAKSQEGEAPKPSAQPSGPVTLKIGGIEYQYTKAVIEAFQKKNPNIKVEFNPGNNDFEDGSIQALLRSGSGPDVMVASSGPGRIGLLADAGLILPIEDTLKKYNIESRYQKWVIDQTRTQGHGKVFELVEGVDVFSVYYNKEMFAKYNLKPPTTWEEFLDICAKLKSAKVPPIAAGFRKGIGGGWMLGNLLEASAGKDRMTDVIYGNGKFDQKEIILGGEMLKQLVDGGYVDGKEASAIDQAQAQAAFINGQAAMTISSQGFIASERKKGGDVSKFDSFLLPSRESGRPARPSAGLAHSWVVNATTKNRDAADKWLDWVSSEEYLQIAAANGGALVPVIEAASKVKNDPAIEAATAMLKNGAGYNPSVYLPAKAKDAWYAAADGIVTGTLPPAEAMKAVEAELSKAKQAAAKK
ncbi:ABC transporter substrate-binding protein [Paenibacillus cremeus]|uniref:Extracellular solute-binding protein n=1 Tax=Paenibacillus cremeus TaxID=2163881 RepID=A0A559K710_9BACL|nr:extracellular solute-binding protein [Paenibacillus cremeus]TVY07920.1 extracellular solute-binding protein [Paenibacillus cremeus]